MIPSNRHRLLTFLETRPKRDFLIFSENIVDKITASVKSSANVAGVTLKGGRKTSSCFNQSNAALTTARSKMQPYVIVATKKKLVLSLSNAKSFLVLNTGNITNIIRMYKDVPFIATQFMILLVDLSMV